MAVSEPAEAQHPARGPSTSLSGRAVLPGPVAKVAGDAVSSNAPARPPSSGSSMPPSSAGARPTSSMSDRSHISGRTGISSGGASGVVSSAPTSVSSLSGRSVVSVLSLNRNRNAPNMQLRQQCDLEALKLRYIQSITAKGEVQADQRLDCGDVQHTIALLDRRSPSLGPALCISVVCLAMTVGLCIGLGLCRGCWQQALWEASAAWLVAVLVLDLATVIAIAAVQFRLLQGRLAARRDQRWKRVEQRRAQKAEAMRAAAEATASAAARADTAAASARSVGEFDHHLATFLSGKAPPRG